MYKLIIETFAAICFLGIGILGFYQGQSYYGDSSLLPTMVSGLLIGLCIIWLLQIFIFKRIDFSTATQAGTGRKLFALIALIAAYLVAASQWGVITFTALFIPAVSLILGYRNKKAIVASTALFVALIYAVFSLLLSTPLPPEAISLILFG